MLTCEKCGLAVPAINSLYYHLMITHQYVKRNHVVCNEPTCLLKFPNWNDFRRHLINVHRYPVNPVNDESSNVANNGDNISQDTENSTSCFASRPESAECSSTETKSEIVEASENLENTITDVVFLFAAKLYADHNLPRSTVQNLIGETSDLVSEIVAVVQPLLVKQLKQCKASDNALKETESLFDSLKKPFLRLATEYRRFQSFEETGDLIMPVPYIVGDRVDDVTEKGRVVKKITNVTATHVPMRKVLKKFMELPGVLSSILKHMGDLEDENGIISNFVQCQVWKDKKKHFAGKVLIPLFLYYDDFEINNPLGSHKGVHKLGALYYSIPCLPPQFCSTVDNIFLGLLFHATDRQVYGNDKIFNVIVKELNVLQEEGIVVKIGDEEKVICFALGLVLGDNLGLNSVFDFVSSFNAKHYCRFCVVPKNECRHSLRENPNKLRKIEFYENDLALGEELTGLKQRSVWNSIKHFHVYRNPAVCTLHDYFEGLCRHNMPKIIYHYVCKVEPVSACLSLDVLNARIKSFGYYEKGLSNVPPLISRDDVAKKSLSMSGSEMRTFVVIFSMLVGDLIVQDDVWRYFLLFRKIVDIISARSFHYECPDYFNCLVEEHHQMYLKVFGRDEWLKPKEHFMTHSGTIMRESGPLLHLSTIRFESKHQKKKREAVVCNSRVNVTYTLALKEQLLLCYRFLKREGLSPKDEGGKGVPLDCTHSNCDNTEYWEKLPNEFKRCCIQRTWYKLNGIVYRIGTFVILKENEFVMPHFGKILKIIQNENGQLCFVCMPCVTLCYNEHFHAYEVEETTEFSVKVFSDFVSPFPVIQHRMPCGTLFVTLKHAL